MFHCDRWASFSNRTTTMTKSFTTELFTEHSSSPQRVPMGVHENTMEWFPNERGTGGLIEWTFWPKGRYTQADTIHIGVWFSGKVVTDYDGVFDLPEEAIQMLKDLGYDTDNVSNN